MFKKLLKLNLTLIFLVLLVPAGTFAQDIDFPDPENYVSDFANVISTQTENSLNEQLTAFEDQTTNQIFVVSVPDFQGAYMEDYAVRLFEAWGIGQADTDNGVLLLFVPEGESGSRVRLEVGYGLEGALTDANAGSILDNDFLPYYNVNDYDNAVQYSVNSIIDAIEGEYIAPETSTSADTAGEWFPIIFFFGFFVLAILGGSKSWWLGGCLGFLFGVVAGATWFRWWGIFVLPVPMALGGLLIDFLISKTGMFRGTGRGGTWSSGGGFSGGGGGGFSGGGGSSGGGGASR